MAQQRCLECGRFVTTTQPHDCNVKRWGQWDSPKVLASARGATIHIPFATRQDALQYAKKHRIPVTNCTYGW